jgi:pimeloyl-ACP methyl ester carboxylesterase
LSRASQTLQRSYGAAQRAYRAIDADVRVHVAQLPLIGLSMLVSKRQRIRRLPDDGRRPVLLVHGLASGPGVFLPMRLFLRLDGRTRTYALHLPDSSVEVMAAFLEDAVLKVCKVNALAASQRVDIIAHSMGGLVARLALDNPRVRRRVHTLVTLGTPHAGTHAARYVASLPGRDLRPDSALLARLRRQLPWRGPPSQPQLVAFWSPGDVLMLPASAARIRGGRNIELPGFTHLSYLLRPAGFRRVVEALRS